MIGFLVANIFAGKKEGRKPRLILKTRNHNYHLHHWIIALVILIFLIVLKYFNDFVYGVLIGVIIQGLTYKDFYEIRTDKK